jgi:hypothetical protein
MQLLQHLPHSYVTTSIPRYAILPTVLYSTSRTNNLGSRLEHPHPRAYTRRIQNFGSPNNDAPRLRTHVPGKSFPIPNPFPTGVSTGVPTGSPTGSPTNYRKSKPASRTRIARGRLTPAREQFFQVRRALGSSRGGFWCNGVRWE